MDIRSFIQVYLSEDAVAGTGMEVEKEMGTGTNALSFLFPLSPSFSSLRDYFFSLPEDLSQQEKISSISSFLSSSLSIPDAYSSSLASFLFPILSTSSSSSSNPPSVLFAKQDLETIDSFRPALSSDAFNLLYYLVAIARISRHPSNWFRFDESLQRALASYLSLSPQAFSSAISELRSICSLSFRILGSNSAIVCFSLPWLIPASCIEEEVQVGLAG